MEAPTEAGVAQTPSPGKPTFSRILRKYALQIAIIGVAFFVWVVFLIGSPRVFLGPRIYQSFMQATPFFALIAIPLTLVIITAEIDLSFPSIMAFGMTAFAVVFVRTESVWLGFIACLLAGALAGLLNGLIVVKVGIPSLVATIGTQFFWRGVVMVVTNGNGIGLTPVKETILYSALVGRIGGVIPAQFIWTIIFGVVVWFLLNRHKFGAHIYLVGDNVESARLMGINVDRTKILAFMGVGLAAAFAGFVVSEQLLYFWPTLGEGYFLNALASVFLGGTSVFGGSGTILGTFVASFIIGAIGAGIVAAGLTGFWTNLIYGLIIIVSVSLQAVVRRRLG
jgi:simple sugar transport system permease protein